MKKLLFLGIAILFYGTSCTNMTSDPEVEEEVVLSDSVSDQFTNQLGAVRKNIEQTTDMYNNFYELDIPYNSLLGDNKTRQMDLTAQKALAFGANASNFVYSSSYNQTQEAAQYLDNVVQLADELGVRKAFDEQELRQLAENSPEVDKSAILTRVYLKASEQLKTEERAILVSFMVVGGWVEGMKLTYQSCEEYLDRESIRLGVYDQTYSYYSCVRLLKNFESNQEAQNLIDALLPLEPAIEAIVKSRGEINKRLFHDVSKEIAKIRKEIQDF